MIKNYNKIPCNVKITNKDITDITLRLICVSITIPANDSIELTIPTSEALALLNAKSNDENLNIIVDLIESPEESEDEKVHKINCSSKEELIKLVTESRSDDKPVEIILQNDINMENEVLNVTQPYTTITGNGHKLLFNAAGQNIVQKTNNCVYTDMVIENTADTSKWNSTYVVQLFKADAAFKNVTIKGGNAAILVNGGYAHIFENINISNNSFGGIELAKGKNVTTSPKLIVEGNLINVTEEKGKPTIWIDGLSKEDVTINSKTQQFFDYDNIKENQIQFYINEITD